MSESVGRIDEYGCVSGLNWPTSIVINQKFNLIKYFYDDPKCYSESMDIEPQQAYIRADLVKSIDSTANEIPKGWQWILQKHADGRFSCQVMSDEYNKKYVCRGETIPEAILKAIAYINEDK